MEEIKVVTPSRLHFGQIDLNGSLGRIYGGIGVGIDSPNFIIRVARAAGLKITADSQSKEIIISFLESLREQGYLEGDPDLQVTVEAAIPGHIGLGSSTQTGLGVGFAISKILGLELDLETLAGLTDRRGSRSAIGFGAFKYGGFILDAGRPLKEKENNDYLPPVLFKHSFPEKWHFVLVIPRGKEGLSGKKEVNTFRKIRPMAERVVERNTRLILMKMIPALVEEDIESFGTALTEVQENIGDYFQQVQEGRFATDVSQDIIDHLLAWGASGAGQSSWGPLLYGLLPGREKAIAIGRRVRKHFADDVIKVFTAGAFNRGIEQGWSRWAKI